MLLSYWMIFVAALLPYSVVGIFKSQKDYDNANPRAWEKTLTGIRQRAHACENNHFEAFAPFAAAVIVAQLKGAGQHHINLLAVSFIAIRVAYTIAYLADVPKLRTPLWIAGFGVVIALFVS